VWLFEIEKVYVSDDISSFNENAVSKKKESNKSFGESIK